MAEPLFQSLDCYMLRVTDLDAGIDFYANKLGHELIWKTDTSAGFALQRSDTELVISTELGPEVDLAVDDVPGAYKRLLAAGATPVQAPFDIPIGLCALVKDPFGNVLTLLDTSKGLLKTAPDKTVVGDV